MIARCFVLIGALVLSSCALATAAEDDSEVFLFSMGLDEQSELVWAMKQSRLQAIPVWKPGGNQEAPLSPNKAVTVADEYVQNTLGVQGATAFTIHLMQLGLTDNHWAYDIGSPRTRHCIAMIHASNTFTSRWTERSLFPRSDRGGHINPHLSKRCRQSLAGVRLHFPMINTRSFQASLAVTSGG